MSDWFVYIVRCADKTLYTGIAMDVARRIEEHNNDDRLAAKYTRVRRPVELKYAENCASRSDAAKREAQIKKLTKSQKEKLINLPEL